MAAPAALERWPVDPHLTVLFNSRTPEWAWLSNFWQHELWIPTSLGPACFGSVEAAYQFAKHRPEAITWSIMQIWGELTPRQAKERGKGIALRPDWNERKETVMRILLDHKFALGEELTGKLLATAPMPLVHLSPWDRFWGVDEQGVGANRLGELLMERRTVLLHKRTDRVG